MFVDFGNIVLGVSLDYFIVDMIDFFEFVEIGIEVRFWFIYVGLFVIVIFFVVWKVVVIFYCL